MRRPPLLPIALLIAGLQLGCLPGPVPTTVARSPLPLKRPVPSASPIASTIPVVTPSGAPTTTPQAVTLEGTIRLPAGIIGNNGSGLIGKIRFPGIVGNNGGNYRTLGTVEQALAVGATVQLVDAAGVAVKGPDGQPLTAVTDEEGRFRFTAPLPGQHLVAVVQLPESKGAIQAIVPTGRKQVDADLVSTLTTGYILDQYVKGQANPVGTLAKLPAEVEATTRARADAALTGGTTAVPDALTTEKVVATVNTLRQKDKALDDQMEAVKKLLIVAGISNLGDGRPAAELLMETAEILPAPDGVYIRPFGAGTYQASRVWKLRSDNTMAIVSGNGAYTTGSLTGKKAAEVGLEGVADLALDAQGRLLILEEDRLSRLEADGTLTTLWDTMPIANAMVVLEGGELLVMTGWEDDPSIEAWSLTPGGTPTKKATVPRPEGAVVVQAGRTSTGKIHVLLDTDATSNLFELDVAAGTFKPVSGAGYITALDDQGRIASPRTGTRFAAHGQTGTTDHGPLPAGSVEVAAFCRLPDGKAIVATDVRIFRVDQQQWMPVTRPANEPHRVGPATDFHFMAPAGLAVGPDGTVYVTDVGLYRMYRIDPAQQIHLLAGGGKAYPPTGKPAVEIELGYAAKVRFTSDGRLAFADDDVIATIDAQGRYQVLQRMPDPDGNGLSIDDFVYAPDGTLYVAASPYDARKTFVIRVPPGGAPGTIHTDAAYYGLALHPDGTLYMATNGHLLSWTAAGGVQRVKEDTRFDDFVAMRFDAQQRLLLGSGRQLLRYDLKDGTFTAIAGPGGRVLNGTGADDSLNNLGDMAFDAAGNLLVTDLEHHQIKRIPKDQL